MKVANVENSAAHAEVRGQLVDLGGRMSQEFGFGRIPGSILVYLYLSETECSLDTLERDLHLSKAAVSTATRHLESLGLVRRVWRKGERKNLYRSADNIGAALQDGLLTFIGKKMQIVSRELESARETLRADGSGRKDPQKKFLETRISRALELRDWAVKIVKNRLLNVFFDLSSWSADSTRGNRGKH